MTFYLLLLGGSLVRLGSDTRIKAKGYKFKTAKKSRSFASATESYTR